MSYTNGTTHYNLPQTTGSDKRDWSDTNQAFADVDAALYGAVQDTAQAELDIDALETRMDAAEQNIATNTGDISGLDTRLTTAEGAITSMSGQITDTRQDLEDMICAYNEASATSTHAYTIGDYFIYNDVLYKATAAIAIGDTIVPDTNCDTTNVSSELLQIKSDIPDVSGITEMIDETRAMITSNVLSSDLADRNYAVGESLILNDVLYRVILPINAGSAITVNTNVVAQSATDRGFIELYSINGDGILTCGQIIAGLAPYLPTSPAGYDISMDRYIIRFGNNIGRYSGFNTTSRYSYTITGPNSIISADMYPYNASNISFFVNENGTERNASMDTFIGTCTIYLKP